MAQSKQQIDALLPKRIRTLPYFVCAIAAGLALLAFVSAPHRLRPGQVIDEVGDYRFPTGKRTLSIAEDDFGNIHVTVQHKATRLYFIPYSYSDRPTLFESERDWFVSVDQYDRLWIYHGHWDRAWGELRQMPSGGTIPYAPAVLMHGLSFTASGHLVSGSNVVTATGKWAGVPQPFFDRIPDRESAQWGNVPVLPRTALQFTTEQQAEVSSRIRQAS
ncbi:MAG TPA: hypothetical protein EYQ63_31220 [Fuerstia sp.]|nr:hypothetical protein [Fuerstiella sp.]